MGKDWQKYKVLLIFTFFILSSLRNYRTDACKLHADPYAASLSFITLQEKFVNLYI